jgi:hypothetical protein
VTTSELLTALWRDYTEQAPQAERIHRLLREHGEVIHDDHVALRTLDLAGLGLEAMARTFEDHGWRGRAFYRLGSQHLRARYWQHDDPNLPKIFISELVVDELSPAARDLLHELVDQLPADFADREDLAWAGRPWHVTAEDIAFLDAESEHAAWIAQHGFRVHHFTVDASALVTFPDLHALAAFVAEHGFDMSFAGDHANAGSYEFMQRR